MSPHQVKRVALLSLPKEIREMIFKEALYMVRRRRFKILSLRAKHKQRPRRANENELALLLTCKQIKLEGSPLFYAGNCFVTGVYPRSSAYRNQPNVQALKEFLQRTPVDCVAAIRDVLVLVPYTRHFDKSTKPGGDPILGGMTQTRPHQSFGKMKAAQDLQYIAGLMTVEMTGVYRLTFQKVVDREIRTWGEDKGNLSKEQTDTMLGELKRFLRRQGKMKIAVDDYQVIDLSRIEKV